MKNLSLLAGLASCAALIAAAAPANATIGFADVVLDYHDSGAGPFAGPYGGTLLGAFPVAVATSVVLGTDSVADPDFLSLPTGSYVTVGFTDETIVNGVGNDIFISEVGASFETANIFVSSNGTDFTFLGLATSGVVTAFDLGSIGYLGAVTAVKIVGLDAFGGSPGFDLGYVQVLPGAIGQVPEPATWAMMLLGFGGLGAVLRRRRVQSVATTA